MTDEIDSGADAAPETMTEIIPEPAPEPTPEPTPEPAQEPAHGAAADVPPDRMAINPRSAHFDGEALKRGIGIRFKSTQRTNVEEYCISEGWIRVQAGKSRDRKGNPLTLKLSGPVEAWFEDLGEGAPVAQAD